MINRVVLTGRLTKDPEPRTTKTGKTYVSFALAVDRSRKVEGQPEADFINCVAWNRQADTMAQYLHRGSLIGVDGRLQTRNYENQQGQRVYITEVLVESFAFLESRAQSQPGQSGYGQSASQPNQTHHEGYGSVHTSDAYYDDEGIDVNNDLPF